MLWLSCVLCCGLCCVMCCVGLHRLVVRGVVLSRVVLCCRCVIVELCFVGLRSSVLC